MAGTLKAEATLAAANLVFLLLLVGGGVIVPLDKFPEAAQSVLGLLPIAALSDGLRDVLQHGAGIPWRDLGILAVLVGAGPGHGGPLLPLGVSRRTAVPGSGRPGACRSVRYHPRESLHKAPPTMAPVPNTLNPLELIARRWQPSAAFVRRAALATVVMAVIIVVTGGAVRLTQSGLGCSTWPKCTPDSLTPTAAMGINGAHRVRQPHADVRAVRGRSACSSSPPAPVTPGAARSPGSAGRSSGSS